VYHYTYQLTDQTGRSYIGARSCSVYPTDDVTYMSSSKYVHKAIIDGFVFEKKILAVFPTRIDAVQHEINLHDFFDVARNFNFYNRSRQTNLKFDTSGIEVSEETRLKRRIALEKRYGILKKDFRNKQSKKENYSRKIDAKKRGARKGVKQSKSHTEARANAQTGKTGMLNNKGAKPVFAINLLTKHTHILVGRKNISDSGFDPSTVHRICHKKPSSFTHKKHIFRFLTEEEIQDFVLNLKG
jgi:hypothetical protein